MATFSAPTPPFLGPAKFRGDAQSLKPLKRIVIHCTVSPCKRGGARATANYFKHTVTRPSSAHYVVDPGEVLQVVNDHVVAYHAPPNANTIGVELCDPQTGPASRWGDSEHHAMLKRAAELVAELCLAYNVPVRHVGSTLLRLGFRGIAGHIDVSLAWKQTTHTDPGLGFPWDAFIAMVNSETKRLSGKLPIVKPKPPKPPAPEPTVATPHMHYVTANIRNLPNLTRAEETHDLLAVSKLGGVIGWQEIAEPNDVADLTTSLPTSKWTHLHTDTECPISLLSDRWDVVQNGQAMLHSGKLHVSPNRHATWVELHRKGTSLPSVVVLNTHWVSGAFTHPNQEAEAWRVLAWQKAHAGMSELVRSFLSQGKTVIGGGDFNRSGSWDGFAPSHRWLVNGGYDHIFTCEALGGTRVQLDAAGVLGLSDLFTDHPARWAHLSLLPPKK
jgi:hypothetical protein